MKFAWTGEIMAPPTRQPFSPARSMSRPAGMDPAFLKKHPADRSSRGWVRRLSRRISLIRLRTASPLAGRNLNVVMCTGFYTEKHQTEWVKEKSAEELAELLVREIEAGIGETGVRAGIIKLAPDAASGQSRKLCRAGVMASRGTGARRGLRRMRDAPCSSST